MQIQSIKGRMRGKVWFVSAGITLSIGKNFDIFYDTFIGKGEKRMTINLEREIWLILRIIHEKGDSFTVSSNYDCNGYTDWEKYIF